MKEQAEHKQQRGFTETGRHLSFYRGLGISDAQETEIEKLLNDYLVKENEMKAENRKVRNDLVNMIAGNEKQDEEKLDVLFLRIAFLKESREKTTFEHLLKVKEILTVEQSQKMFSKLMEETKKEKD